MDLCLNVPEVAINTLGQTTVSRSTHIIFVMFGKGRQRHLITEADHYNVRF